jgi:hypothetical protein
MAEQFESLLSGDPEYPFADPIQSIGIAQTLT